jgi:hypothetical protein
VVKGDQGRAAQPCLGQEVNLGIWRELGPLAGKTEENLRQAAENFAAWTRGSSNRVVSGLFLFPPNTLRVGEFRLTFPVASDANL